MTEGQLRYQTLLEDKRHNLEIERYNQQQAAIKEREVAVSEEQNPFKIELMQGQASQARSSAVNQTRNYGINLASLILGYVIPDANTVTRAGAQVMSSLFS